MAQCPPPSLSSLYDSRLARIVSNLRRQRESAPGLASEDAEGLVYGRLEGVFEPSKGDTTYDWAALYGSGGSSGSGAAAVLPAPFVGPLTVMDLPGRGLGLVTTDNVEAGTVLLVEEAFALVPASATQGEQGLVEMCAAKLRHAQQNSCHLQRAAAMHLCGVKEEEAGSSSNSKALRKRIFQIYLQCLRAGADPARSTLRVGPEGNLSDVTGPADVSNQRLAEILAGNGRKTEWWDPWTLLLDESRSHAGLWLFASLFNHSCRGNVVITYGQTCRGNETAPWILVARAAIPLKAGEELCHTYIYPFEPVRERQARLSKAYGFHCSCDRCCFETPLAELAVRAADELECEVNAFSKARRERQPAAMERVVRKLRSALGRLDDPAKKAEEVEAAAAGTSRGVAALWRGQFVWGYHGLAMAAESLGHFGEAVEAFRSCVELIVAVAPGSGYELKYRMMLTQCLARQATSGFGQGKVSTLKAALREAEDAHNRCYGGGGRHFMRRMRQRLEEVFMALRTSS